jgi:hypothetical protein
MMRRGLCRIFVGADNDDCRYMTMAIVALLVKILSEAQGSCTGPK